MKMFLYHIKIYFQVDLGIDQIKIFMLKKHFPILPYTYKLIPFINWNFFKKVVLAIVKNIDYISACIYKQTANTTNKLSFQK